MEPFKEVATAFQCLGKYLGEEPYGSDQISSMFKVIFGRRLDFSPIDRGEFRG